MGSLQLSQMVSDQVFLLYNEIMTIQNSFSLPKKEAEAWRNCGLNPPMSLHVQESGGLRAWDLSTVRGVGPGNLGDSGTRTRGYVEDEQ